MLTLSIYADAVWKWRCVARRRSFSSQQFLVNRLSAALRSAHSHFASSTVHIET